MDPAPHSATPPAEAERVRRAIGRLLDAVRSDERGLVHRVVLFGSRARGDARPSSDVDLYVVVERRDRALMDDLYHAVMEALLEEHLRLALKVVPRWAHEQMAAERNRFLQNVEAEGEILWTRP